MLCNPLCLLTAACTQQVMMFGCPTQGATPFLMPTFNTVISKASKEVGVHTTRFTHSQGHGHSGHYMHGFVISHRYWAFSADEMALIDLPATIDYILQVTGYQQVCVCLCVCV
jgi:ABC-type transporter Mla maintaining outer membrane lipid asymmetry ATPase subunit MlaF